MNNSKGHLRSGLKLFVAAAIVWTSSKATAADVYVPFEGEKTAWHEGLTATTSSWTMPLAKSRR